MTPEHLLALALLPFAVCGLIVGADWLMERADRWLRGEPEPPSAEPYERLTDDERARLRTWTKN